MQNDKIPEGFTLIPSGIDNYIIEKNMKNRKRSIEISCMYKYNKIQKEGEDNCGHIQTR